MTYRKEAGALSERDEVLTTQEVARLLKVTQRSVYRWIVAGVLPAAKFGGRWRIKRADVERFWQQRQK